MFRTSVVVSSARLTLCVTAAMAATCAFRYIFTLLTRKGERAVTR